MALPGIAFVDIVGDDRIQAILDDPASFKLQRHPGRDAGRPDPRYGHFQRAVSLPHARSGVRRPACRAAPSLLMEEEARHVVGQKCVSLLVYDDESDAYTFDLSSGADYDRDLSPEARQVPLILALLQEPGRPARYALKRLAEDLFYVRSAQGAGVVLEQPLNVERASDQGVDFALADANFT
jgi:hypothetical protein